MNNDSSSKKTIIIFVIILVISALWYFYSIGSPKDSESSLEINTGEPLVSNAIGSKAVVLLREISSLKIEPEFFSTPLYKSLIDYTVEVPAQNIGRANPFVPFPGQAPVGGTSKAK